MGCGPRRHKLMHSGRLRHRRCGFIPPVEHLTPFGWRHDLDLADAVIGSSRLQPVEGHQETMGDIFIPRIIVKVGVRIKNELDITAIKPVMHRDHQVIDRPVGKVMSDRLTIAKTSSVVERHDVDIQAEQSTVIDKVQVPQHVLIPVPLMLECLTDGPGDLPYQFARRHTRPDSQPDRQHVGGRAGDPALPLARPAYNGYSQHDVCRPAIGMHVRGRSGDKQSGEARSQAPRRALESPHAIGTGISMAPYGHPGRSRDLLPGDADDFRETRELVEPEFPVPVEVGGDTVRRFLGYQHGNRIKRLLIGHGACPHSRVNPAQPGSNNGGSEWIKYDMVGPLIPEEPACADLEQRTVENRRPFPQVRRIADIRPHPLCRGSLGVRGRADIKETKRPVTRIFNPLSR